MLFLGRAELTTEDDADSAPLAIQGLPEEEPDVVENADGNHDSFVDDEDSLAEEHSVLIRTV
jgi:hypothetical protein